MSAPATDDAAAQTLARDIARVAAARQARDVVRQLESELQREDSSEATVVVVGEANRGKSSLINALIGVDELSPVAPDIATSCHIVIRGGDRARTTVHYDDGRSEQIQASEIEHYATAGGKRAGSVTAVESTVPSALLQRGLKLIDTPGVGGLVAGHAEITKAALIVADALLFVLDAESEIGSSELRFLDQVTERVGTVVFAFNKIDDYPEWRRLLEKTRGSLPARFADCPVLAVSSVRRQEALAAAAEGDADWARELDEKSGFVQLEAELDARVLQRRRWLGRGNLLATCHSALEALKRPDEVLCAELNRKPDPRLAESTATVTQEIKSFDTAITKLANEVRDSLEQLRLTIIEEYEQRTLALDRRYKREIGDWPDGFAEDMPRQLQSDLDALAGALHAILLDGLAAIDAGLVAKFGIDGADVAPDVERRGIDLPELAPLRPGGEALKMKQLQMTMMGVGGGRLLGLVGANAAAGAVGLSVGVMTGGLAIAGAVAGIAFAKRAKVQSRRIQVEKQARTLLQESLATARVELLTPLSQRMLTLRRDFQEDLDRRLAARKVALQGELESHRALQTMDLQQRQNARKPAEERLKELAPLQSRLDGFLDDLRSAQPPAT